MKVIPKTKSPLHSFSKIVTPTFVYTEMLGLHGRQGPWRARRLNALMWLVPPFWQDERDFSFRSLSS